MPLFISPNLLYSGLTVATLLFLRLLLPPNDAEQNKLWNKIEKVGVPSGILPWTRAVFGSWTALAENTHKGYNTFCKKGMPFALPTAWTGKAVVVLPPSALNLVNRPENELQAFWALVEGIQLAYFFPDPSILHKPIHFEVARKDLTKKIIERQLMSTAEEIKACFDDIFGDSTEWRTVNGWDTCGQVIARVALRTLLGSPACRNKDVIESTQKFANSLFAGAAIINCMPVALRPYLAPLVAMPTKHYRTKYRETVVPLVEERIRLWEEYEKTGKGELPSDFVQWIISRAAQHGPEHLDSSAIAYRLLFLNTMFIFAMTYVFAHCVIDICASSEPKRFWDGMAAECKTVVAKYGQGIASKDAVDQFYRVDSALRESMRLSDVGVVTIPRDVVGKPFDLGNGIVCPPGTRLMFPTQPIHVDPDYWVDPLRFDAFRFSDPFDREVEGSLPTKEDGTNQDRENLVDLSPKFLVWGYGKKACPGRWYSSQTMKQALAYMVMNYEVELIGQLPKRKALLNMMVPPTGAKLRFRRRAA